MAVHSEFSTSVNPHCLDMAAFVHLTKSRRCICDIVHIRQQLCSALHPGLFHTDCEDFKRVIVKRRSAIRSSGKGTALSILVPMEWKWGHVPGWDGWVGLRQVQGQFISAHFSISLQPKSLLWDKPSYPRNPCGSGKVGMMGL